MIPKILNTKYISKGKWLSLNEITYIDTYKIERKWESVERIASNGAVVILATMKHSKEIVLIRQYRPPVGNFIIEFPAGLIDKGESPEDSAFRELKEETGYTGDIISKTYHSYSSPGLSSETIIYVKMIIDETLPENLNPQTNFDDSEFIELIKTPINQLNNLIEKSIIAGDSIDAKVLTFCEALEFG